jgi:hypothetical protein
VITAFALYPACAAQLLWQLTVAAATAALTAITTPEEGTS